MSTETRDLLLFAVAFLAAMGFVYYYVAAVLEEDRLLSRASAVAFVLFGGLAVVCLWRVL